MESDYVDDFRLETDPNEGYLKDANQKYMIQIETTNEGPDDIERRIRWEQAEERLGKGAFGSVMKEQDDKRNVRAVKRVNKEHCKIADIDYGKELLAMAKLSSSKWAHRFVEFFGWFETSKTVFIAMEYFPLGDLEQYVKQKGSFDVRAVQTITDQLLGGLVAMHKHDFTHRDLKPQNIFVAAEQPGLWIKIGDFGIAKRVRPGDLSALETEIGTPAFRAPEIVYEEPPYTKKVDIWSLGCVVYWLLTQKPPFSRSHLHDFYQTGSRFPIERLDRHRVSKEGIAFLRKSLAVKPEDRPSARQAREDPWIRARSAIASSVNNVGSFAKTEAQDGFRSAVTAQKSGSDNASYELVHLHPKTTDERYQWPNPSNRVEPVLRILGQDDHHLTGTTSGSDNVLDKSVLPQSVTADRRYRHSGSVDKEEPFVGTVLQTDLHLTGTTRRSGNGNASDQPLLSQSAMTDERGRHPSAINKVEPVVRSVLQNGPRPTGTPQRSGSDNASDMPVLLHSAPIDEGDQHPSLVTNPEPSVGNVPQNGLHGTPPPTGCGDVVPPSPTTTEEEAKRRREEEAKRRREEEARRRREEEAKRRREEAARRRREEEARQKRRESEDGSGCCVIL